MLLYHGTTETIARKIMEEGMKPRQAAGNSQWDHTIPSNPECIYLTDAYAPYFAFSATKKKGERWAIIEINTAKLSQGRLMPDEDFLEQATREDKSSWMYGKSMKVRTEFYRDNIEDYQRNWKLSMEHMGTCSYMGTIPVTAITRIAFFDPHSNPMIVGQCLDPTISIMNYAFMKGKYRDLTQWFFDPAYDLSQNDPYAAFGKDDPSFALRNIEQAKMAKESKGLEIVDLRKKSKKTKAESLLDICDGSGTPALREDTITEGLFQDVMDMIFPPEFKHTLPRKPSKDDQVDIQKVIKKLPTSKLQQLRDKIASMSHNDFLKNVGAAPAMYWMTVADAELHARGATV